MSSLATVLAVLLQVPPLICRLFCNFNSGTNLLHVPTPCCRLRRTNLCQRPPSGQALQLGQSAVPTLDIQLELPHDPTPCCRLRRLSLCQRPPPGQALQLGQPPLQQRGASLAPNTPLRSRPSRCAAGISSNMPARLCCCAEPVCKIASAALSVGRQVVQIWFAQAAVVMQGLQQHSCLSHRGIKMSSLLQVIVQQAPLQGTSHGRVMIVCVTMQVMGQQMPSRGSGYGQAAAMQAPAMTGAAPPQPPAAPAPTGPPPTVNVSNVDVSKVGQGLFYCCWSLSHDGSRGTSSCSLRPVPFAPSLAQLATCLCWCLPLWPHRTSIPVPLPLPGDVPSLECAGTLNF